MTLPVRNAQTGRTSGVLADTPLFHSLQDHVAGALGLACYCT
jgi:hypothetical protein